MSDRLRPRRRNPLSARLSGGRLVLPRPWRRAWVCERGGWLVPVRDGANPMLSRPWADGRGVALMAAGAKCRDRSGR